ncbi:MAG: hypothetical protein GY854_17625, partial [Deltaproteobacteria bacterium]|nr:hypothetical protein [Deltaproteobacteria bacterium]
VHWARKLIPPPAQTNSQPNPSDTHGYQPPDGRVISERNIFESSASAKEKQSKAPAPKITEPVVPCDDLSITASAIVMADGDQWPSFASVSWNGRRTDLRIGDAIGGRVVESISWHRIVIRGEDDLCYVDLFSEVTRGARLSNVD